MAVKLSPWGNQQFFDENGDPAVGWKLYTYAAGSSSEQTTYTTEAGDVAQSNPIVLNALGFPTSGQIWLTEGLTYKLVLKNASDVEKKTEDNISGVNDTSSAAGQWASSGVTPTYVNSTSFTLSGDQTNEFHAGRREQFTVTSGTVYGTIASSAYTTLTTVTMTMDSGDALDSGLSAVNHSILRADKPALPNSGAARTALGLDAIIGNAGPVSLRNKIINGGFDVWQYGTSQTGNGYGSDDRWFNGNSGSTKTHSQQAFALGQTDVPGNPLYFSRTVVTSAAGAANFVQKAQKIEEVRTLSGRKATLSFWAKADAAKNIAVEIVQEFGTNGSAPVTGIGSALYALTTVWKKFTVTVDIPSIAGKTVGAGNNLRLNFWFDAGSDFNTRTASLGHQSGTFDIAQVQIEEGTVATLFAGRHIQKELALCQRYARVIVASARFPASGASQFSNTSINWERMRAIPSVSTITAPGTANLTAGFPVLANVTEYGARYEIQSAAAGDAFAINGIYLLSAEL
jgi:hypothetical protein